MASAADVRSILSLPAASATTSHAHIKKQAPKKPDGISRELFALIGPTPPSLAVQLAKPQLKQKPNLRGNAPDKWEWRRFKNSARTDNLQLGRWVKASTELDAEYPFAKYNTPTNIYTYSQEEFTNVMNEKDDKLQWSKEETDYLFGLAREYDLRWFVIADRYEFPGGILRSMEDMKDRYYAVCRRLFRHRPHLGDENSRSATMATYVFDRDRETLRKKYLESLYARTPAQVAEEDALYIEIKRLELTERRFKSDRDQLLRTLLGVESGLPEVVGLVEEDTSFMNGGTGIDSSRKKRRGLGGEMLDSPMTPVVPSFDVASASAMQQKKVNPAKSAAYDLLHNILRTSDSTSLSSTKTAHQAVFLRSGKLPYPKAPLSQKITQALLELRVSPTRLVMPTRENVASLEILLDATTAMVEQKRVVDRVEQEIRTLKMRLGIPVDDEITNADAEGEVETADAVQNFEEQDAAEGGGRAQSVLSTRSSSRKLNHARSDSIESTASTHKRQKTK